MVSLAGRVSKKGILRVALVTVSGWFGEWSYFVSLVRALTDWVYSGDLSAFPRMAVMPPLNVYDPTFWYGIKWGVAFYRGGINPADLLNGLGLILLGSLGWIFYEFLKGSAISK